MSCSLLSTTECVTGIELRLTGWLRCRQTRSSLSSACTAVVAERRCVDGLRIRFHQSPWKIALSLQENRPGLAVGSRGVQCGPHTALRVSGMRNRLRCQWPHGHVERPRAAQWGYCANYSWGCRWWERARDHKLDRTRSVTCFFLSANEGGTVGEGNEPLATPATPPLHQVVWVP